MLKHHYLGRRRSLLMSSLLTIVPYGVYIFLLYKVPIPAGMILPSFWNALFSRLVVVGIVILGLLSGFGAVSNAWDFFPAFLGSARYFSPAAMRIKAKGKFRETPSDQDVLFAEQSLTRIRNDLLSRRQELERRSGATVKLFKS